MDYIANLKIAGKEFEIDLTDEARYGVFRKGGKYAIESFLEKEYADNFIELIEACRKAGRKSVRYHRDRLYPAEVLEFDKRLNKL